MYSLTDIDISEVRAASIVRAMSTTSMRLHGTISQKAVIYILAAMRTRNFTLMAQFMIIICY
jgi:hypothetical protein